MSKQIITLIILLLTFNQMKAQTEEQIINELVFDLFGLHQDTILIENVKIKTYFEYDSVSFERITGLTVPSKIISEWKNNEEPQNYSAGWNEQKLNKIDTLFTEKDTVISKNPFFISLTKGDINQLFERTKKRQKIYSISKILFDNSKENAIFHFILTPWPGDFYFETILIKKIFGKWKIITRFDISMT